jgi:hypothetical protein
MEVTKTEMFVSTWYISSRSASGRLKNLRIHWQEEVEHGERITNGGIRQRRSLVKAGFLHSDNSPATLVLA